MELNEVLNLGMSSATALLGIVLGLLAILPVVLDLISTRVRAYFKAGRERARLTQIFAVLLAIAAVLTVSLLISLISIFLPAAMCVAAYFGIAALVLSMVGFGWVLVIAGLILKAVAASSD